MKFRITHWIRILHRDIGYIAAGLTVIYAISGIAVNHVDEWNPNYTTETVKLKMDPIPTEDLKSQEIVNKILFSIGETGKIKNTFRPDPKTLQIFVEGNTITVNSESGEIIQEKISSRTILRETNFLHLNAPKKVWTYVADLFAVALLFLAISGLFMIKGSKGIKGRGAWLSSLGLLIPIIFLLIYYY
ncbi:MAG: PepSY-associated TM helix domain-containing protein [Ignavibacteriales bacterium]|nr:MAG: PepSY-associated TM helix domain-containing protein [Ignavibacteriales bacterium]